MQAALPFDGELTEFTNLLPPLLTKAPGLFSATMSFGGQTPTIIVLKEGTDASQGKGQILSNINACLAVQDTIRSTLGPYGGDLLLVDADGRQTITNDGATVMKVGKITLHMVLLLIGVPSFSILSTPQLEFSQT